MTATQTQQVSLLVELSLDDWSELRNGLSKPHSITMEEMATEMLQNRAASWRFKRREDERRGTS